MTKDDISCDDRPIPSNPRVIVTCPKCGDDLDITAVVLKFMGAEG
ncbi:MAG: hypothetical protein PHI12_13825 [Dehalococcoidales bacterium]|nr:hypothetical protein [Dehalococcoidales bacterium]